MSDHDNDGRITFRPTPGVADERSTFTLTPGPCSLTGLDVQARSHVSHIEEFRVARYNVRTPDADGYSILSTRDLPVTVTAHQLAQIIDMTLRLPTYVVERDFPGVAHLFKPVSE